MREMVIFYITERLLKRFPKILCQHFIECIFHYNCYEPARRKCKLTLPCAQCCKIVRKIAD
ncbi:Condensin-2 complex subunit D3 [Portunus trituberculatus]|uniref:Condensin-2 complex subunit D3 n=1 Tax=Portunus trituberculatus TaxID=210409 RepID=A0A5B7FPG8_PORTR|nr:Condensin-2 complex subunit D3 [Portunus trituberculatus]